MIPELLSPARNVETAKCAILAGADAVYIGAPKFGARKDAANSAEEIAQLCKFAHLYGCRVYVALNTILFDGEIENAARLCETLWNDGADAIIAQDLGLLGATDRRVKFHASTQCNIDSPQKAKFLEKAGFAAVVLARETGLAQTAETAKTVSVPIECFAHGALCVSYSGQCYLSYAIGGRSGNRGECAQPCRMLYEFADADGKRIAPPAYYLSLRDMNRIGRLSDMLDAGVSIFKIEGRLKDAAYVKNITAAYRAALDEQLRKRNLPMASFGESQMAFAPDPQKSFNRLFCTYHLDGVEKGCSSFQTPKARGEFIGIIKKSFDGGFVFPRAENIFSNGDGLFFDVGENKNGFGAAVRSVDGEKVFVGRPDERVKIPPNAKIFRNRDVKFEERLAAKISRKMAVEIEAAQTEDEYVFKISTADARNASAEIRIKTADLQPAQNPESAARRLEESLAKLGDTAFRADFVKIGLQTFPHLRAADANALRRDLVGKLETEIIAQYEKARTSYVRPMPQKCADQPRPPFDCDARANVSNKYARKFYESLGVDITDNAPEAGGDLDSIPLMRTRHCILRELGMCKKTGNFGGNFKEPFRLKSADGEFKITFDCKNCQMLLRRI